jgi:glycosyltransferase involved in cell wall biosynthesis
VFLNRFYYLLKPLLPAPVRIALRRRVADRRRALNRANWPISESAGVKPAGWTGWPGGKQFAVVLTHDVEGPAGLESCHSLMQLEADMGFRSSFNFIPEGTYDTPAGLRSDLRANGFEVGVHDLRHDGKLYWSRKRFKGHASRINRYLEEWNAEGFRSGFMLRNLQWFHDLNISYDASTFDTDPFEPQPDGANTIFPFWVPARENRNGGRGGYMELPYTLPQDFTLFVLLRERSPNIWKRKLDWIAERGGMALLDLHPDYVAFDGQRNGRHAVCPASVYQEFLTYIRTQYPNAYWHALPRDVARFCTEMQPRPARTRTKSVCMLSYSFYESDNRVMRYAETLAKRGDQVDVIALDSGRNRPKADMPGVDVYRIQTRKNKGSQKKADYMIPILRFCLRSSIFIARCHLKRRYDVIHVHNIPDFLVFAAWLPKLMGARVILDIHDIVPEFYASKFGAGRGNRAIDALKYLERRSARYADHVIISNHLWKDRLVARSVPAERCSVMINYVDPAIFHPRKRTRSDGKLIVLFPGGLQWHQGLDIAIRAFRTVQERLPNAEFHIYGDGQAKGDLMTLVRELQLESKVLFFDPVPMRSIPQLMADADLGVVPKRADSFGDEAYSTKIMEFMSVGVPVIVSETRIDKYYFDNLVVRFFPSGNSGALAEAMIELLGNPELRKSLSARGIEYAARNNWDTRKADYLQLVDSLAI